MENKLVVLLIEDDPVACYELKTYFAKCNDMTLIETTNDADVGLKLVFSHLPNVILLDLELHHGGGNGIMFLHKLNTMGICHLPYIIVTTNNMSDVTLAQARELGADFIITKYDTSYSPEYIGDTIRLMQAAILRKNAMSTLGLGHTPAQMDNLLERRIQREMDLIGINPKNKGYNYLVDCIINYIEDPTINLSRSLVKKYVKNDKSIERAMQNAIKRAWDTNDIDNLTKYYTAHIRLDKGYPTLMEFVCYYASKVQNDIKSEKLGVKIN